jgi:hypothetical protein
VLSGVHVVPLHFPLQHAGLPASFEQAAPSEMQAAAAQKPLAPQLSEQQSVGAEHGVPCAKHFPTTEVHRLVAESQTPEQHVAPLVHTSLKTPHEIDPSGACASPAADPPLPPVELPAAPAFPPPAPPTDASGTEASVFAPPVEPPAVPEPALPPLALLLPPAPAPPPVRIEPPAPPDVPARPPVARESTEASLGIPPSPVIGPAASSPPHPHIAKRQARPTSLWKFMCDGSSASGRAGR